MSTTRVILLAIYKVLRTGAQNMHLVFIHIILWLVHVGNVMVACWYFAGFMLLRVLYIFLNLQLILLGIKSQNCNTRLLKYELERKLHGVLVFENIDRRVTCVTLNVARIDVAVFSHATHTHSADVVSTNLYKTPIIHVKCMKRKKNAYLLPHYLAMEWKKEKKKKCRPAGRLSGYSYRNVVTH